jgi:transposase
MSDRSLGVARRSFASSLGTASPLKKSLRAAEQQRPDVARARRRWIRDQGLLNPARLVFIDETAVTTNMVRLNGRSPRGERLVGIVPQGHWETVTLVAGLRCTGIVAPMVFKGAMNAETFLAYLEQCLCPTLKRWDSVIIDNLSAHHDIGVEEPIRAVGAKLRYLPQYSPDLNPIEMLFHQLKALLRKLAKRTIDDLSQCIGSFIRVFDPAQSANYFRHAGYEPL